MNTTDRRSPSVRRRARVGATALAAVVLGLTVAPVTDVGSHVVAGDSSSDIPGIPLPGPVASGPLGGDIYDVVYRLDVAPGTVVLANLSGPVGTDFDLYLFDASATTVIANRGVVARATGPSSDESISYATSTGGRFYVDLNSATPAAGTYTLVVQVVADQPPLANLVLDGGRPRTNSTTVSASLTVSGGSLSGPVRMAFSADGTTWESWEPYQAVTDRTVQRGDGMKTLWAKVENAAGAISAAAAASIMLDTDRPSLISIDPAVNADLVGPRPTITATFSEAIDPASWTNYGLVLQTPGGVLIPGTYAMGPAPDVATFRPSEDLVAGATYIITVGSVLDVAGNLVAPTGSWVAVDRAAPKVSLAATPRVVNQGATALLAGRLVAPAGVAMLSLEARPGGSAEVIALGTVPVAADGAFAVRVTPSSTTEYRVLVPAAGSYGAGSAGATVAVRRAVRITGPGSSVVRAGRVGAVIPVSAVIVPAADGVAVGFRLERLSATTRAWRLVGTVTRRADAAGQASVAWTPKGAGLYRWRATAATTPDFSTAASAWIRWSIGR